MKNNKLRKPASNPTPHFKLGGYIDDEISEVINDAIGLIEDGEIQLGDFVDCIVENLTDVQYDILGKQLNVLELEQSQYGHTQTILNAIKNNEIPVAWFLSIVTKNVDVIKNIKEIIDDIENKDIKESRRPTRNSRISESPMLTRLSTGQLVKADDVNSTSRSYKTNDVDTRIYNRVDSSGRSYKTKYNDDKIYNDPRIFNNTQIYSDERAKVATRGEVEAYVAAKKEFNATKRLRADTGTNADIGTNAIVTKDTPEYEERMRKHWDADLRNGWRDAEADIGTNADIGEARNNRVNEDKEFNNIIKLAKRGDVEAQYRLGMHYVSNEETPGRLEKAVKWFTLAAEQDHGSAQYHLGVMYAKGRGVSRSKKAAVKWYKLSAEQGNAAARNNLRLMHGNGDLEESRRTTRNKLSE